MDLPKAASICDMFVLSDIATSESETGSCKDMRIGKWNSISYVVCKGSC